MTKLNLSRSDPTFLAFDGEILECLFEDGSKRLHIAFIKGIQLGPNQKGKHLLTINLNREPLFLWVEEEMIGKLNELIAEIQNAKAALKL